MSDELWSKSAIELAELISSGQASSREVVNAHLDRIEATNPAVNAVTVVLAESARAAADAADAASEPTGPLHGVPFSSKENVDLSGSATTRGVEALADAVVDVDAPNAARMKAAGAIPLARTNMPELGLRIDTTNPLRGRTYNPWQRDRTAGGSSGGEGAALACGMTPIGLGNDIGGSVRNPAFCNGVAALKPTRGRVPRVYSLEPANPGLNAQVMSVEGPMARTVADLRLGLRVIAGRHIEDPMSVDAPLTGLPSPRTAAIVVDNESCTVDPTCADAARSAGRALESAGWNVVEAAPPELDLVHTLWGAMMAADVLAMGPMLEQMMPGPLAAMLSGFAGRDDYTRIPATQVHVERHRLGRLWSRFFVTYSVVVMPTWTRPQLGHDEDLADGGTETVIDTLRFITPANLLGLPACSVPTGVANGLPTGVQVYADLWREDLTLDAAADIEASLGTFAPIDPR